MTECQKVRKTGQQEVFVCNLLFGICYLFVIWDLEFVI